MDVRPVIRTPDQRVRVFVSSTLGELAEERAAVRTAIEQLRLVPVMFELGARPHPPRDLYRAYLDQSEVFVGIYGESYGWIAPGEEWSGLEDEYRLAGDRPRLLYLKRPAPHRDPRLEALIERFADDDAASYRHFSSADELATVVADDLAVLLSERFSPSSEDDESPRPATRAAIPAPPTAIVGRDDLVASVVALLEGGARSVTLTGTGGIGKTRLAVAVADALGSPPVEAFVSLSSVADADRALRTIADALGARHDGARSPLDVVVDAIGGRPAVLVLDNLEQIGDIGPPLAELLERAPDLQILATSRRALRIRAEQEVAVPPLALPDGARPATDDLGPAVALFVERARATGVDLDLESGDGDDRDDRSAIVEICRRLDGLPLAIELAAARVRLLGPQVLLERLTDRFDLLVGAGPDVPQRQRTLRATIDWSHQLLTASQRALFARLTAFRDGFTLDAAEAVCGGDGVDVLDDLAALLDVSLVVPPDHDGGGPPRFSMLESIWAYARERLDERGERRALAQRHLDHYLAVGELAQPYLCGPGQRGWVRELGPERANLRAAVATALDEHRYADVVELTWDVIVLYFVLDGADEPSSWMAAVAGAAPDLDEVTEAKLRSLHALTRIHRGDYDGVLADLEEPLAVFDHHGMTFEGAVALHQLGFVRYRLLGDVPGAVECLRASSANFASVGHQWGVALVEAMLASVLAAEGDLAEAEACASRSLENARAIDNEQQVVQALQQLAFIRLSEGCEADALPLLVEAADVLRRSQLRTDTTYCLDALALIALSAGDVTTAADAVTAASAERARLGVAPWPTLEQAIEQVHEATRRQIGDDAFAQRRAAADGHDLFAVLDATLAALRG